MPQQPHRRPDQRHKEKHGRGHSDGQCLGAAQRQRFGHQFAHHNVKIGNDSKAQRYGAGGRNVGVNMSRSGTNRQHIEPAQKDARCQRLADPAQRQRAEGDAELHSGQKVVQFPLQTPHGAGSGNTGSQHLLDPRIPDRDQREFGGHKEAVGQNQHGYSDKLKQRKTVHLACENSI